MDVKICSKCKIPKSLNDFSPHKRYKSGLQSVCKKCKKQECKEFRRTQKGLIYHIYRNQIINSKVRKDVPPNYTLEELDKWIRGQKHFEKLYKNWVDSNFTKNLVPSVDRKDDYKPYTFDNIQLVTWEENNLKGFNDRRLGINTKKNRGVTQSSLEGVFIKKFNSIKEAQEETNIKNISHCCNGTRKSAGGYKWEFNN